MSGEGVRIAGHSATVEEIRRAIRIVQGACRLRLVDPDELAARVVERLAVAGRVAAAVNASSLSELSPVGDVWLEPGHPTHDVTLVSILPVGLRVHRGAPSPSTRSGDVRLCLRGAP